MASWLKAAEDLFEVVDRRAKLVVSELADEQAGSQSPASNGQGSQVQANITKSKTKAQRRQSSDGVSKISDAVPVREQNSLLAPQGYETPEKEREGPLNQNDGTLSNKSVVRQINEQLDNLSNDTPILSTPITETLGNDDGKIDHDHGKVPVTAEETTSESVISTPNGDLLVESTQEVREENSLPLLSEKIEIASEDNPVEADPEVKSADKEVPPKFDQGSLQSETIDVPNDAETQLKVADFKVQTKQEEQNSDTSPMKVQEQLDEAQRLLKSSNSSGQSKEARLAKVCAGLSSRLQEYKAENAQLEELLVAERELSKSCESHVKQLQQDLSESKSEVTRVESNMAEALAAKNSEIEALVNSLDALKKQSALSEGNLASLQANMESIMRNRELTETRMMQALREELASVERRAEEERAAHNATKMASMEREVELEHRAMDSSTALARIQRVADERTAKAADLEQKLALLEVECANLNQELQDMEAKVRRGLQKSPDEANQAIQIQAWQEKMERAQQGQRDAESKLSLVDAEVQKMRVEMAAMKRDAEHYSRQEHMELEKRYRELTDLLYYKQTQLEAMASEKAAAEFQLEKELTRRHEAQVEVERSRVSRNPSASWEEDTEMKSLEPLPLHHRHMDKATVQLQKAAKLLDSGAVRATRFLWRYPTARVILLFYLVFVHLFLMYLLHRLQEQADELSVKDAKSMGISNPIFP